MRITDAGGEDEGYSKKPTSSIMDSIKAKANVNKEFVDNTDEPAPKITADVQSAKLKQLLGQIKTS